MARRALRVVDGLTGRLGLGVIEPEGRLPVGVVLRYLGVFVIVAVASDQQPASGQHRREQPPHHSPPFLPGPLTTSPQASISEPWYGLRMSPVFCSQLPLAIGQ